MVAQLFKFKVHSSIMRNVNSLKCNYALLDSRRYWDFGSWSGLEEQEDVDGDGS